MSSRRRADLPVEDSWRMVDGEHDSFDTTILASVDDDEFLAPLSSGQPSSGFPSQPSSDSQGPFGFGSQDSIGDFAKHQEDEQVILRTPFRPSLPSAASNQYHLKDSHRTPDPQFKMPMIDMDTGRKSSGRSSRTIRALGGGPSDEGIRRRGEPSFGSPSRRRNSRKRGIYVKEDRDTSDEDWQSTIAGHVRETVPGTLADAILWTFDKASLTFRYARRPITLFLVMYVCFGGAIIVQNTITGSIFTSLTPFCRIPGALLLGLPFCPSPNSDVLLASAKPGPLHFNSIIDLQSRFEDVLEKSIDGVALPFEMRQSEMAMRDLRILVKQSDLHARDRDRLLFEFDRYIETIHPLVADFLRFNSHVGTAVDGIINVNRWTSRQIESLATETDSQSSIISDFTTWLFRPFQPNKELLTERLLLDQYIKHTVLVSDRIQHLVNEGNSVLNLLTTAEDHLSAIHDITHDSTTAVPPQRDQILSALWARVGGNASRQRPLSKQLSVLKKVDDQRSTAVTQVRALILELRSIQAGLGGLRDLVADAGPQAGHLGVPLRVHLHTVDDGIDKLQDTRNRLRVVHKERIHDALQQTGVEREDEGLMDT